MIRPAFWLIQVHLLIAVLFALPYFNWQYAKEHGFGSWIMFGEVIATAQATAWPYYVVSSWGKESHNETDLHFVNSCNACSEALRIVEGEDGLSELSSSQAQEVVSLLQSAVDEAELVSEAYLQRLHPDFLTQFTNGYTYSLRTLIVGLQTDSTGKQIMGLIGYNNFSQWMRDHADEITF